MISSRQIVQRSLAFDSPPRIPLMFERSNLTDVLYAPISPDRTWNPVMKRWSLVNKSGDHIDEWGCIWRVASEEDIGYVIGHPIDDLEKAKSYKLPDPEAEGRFDDLQKITQMDKYSILFFWNFLFERLWMLHGYQATLIDLALGSVELERLLDGILNFYVRIVEKLHREGMPVEGIGIGDDWGTDISLMISPVLWKRVFKNRYSEFIHICHQHGYRVWMHSDGDIREILDDLIEIGLDAINIMSPAPLGIEEIGKDFRGRIAFFSSIDHQETLARGGEQEIRNDIKRLVQLWGASEGGLVLYFSDENADCLGVDKDKQELIRRIMREYSYLYSRSTNDGNTAGRKCYGE